MSRKAKIEAQEHLAEKINRGDGGAAVQSFAHIEPAHVVAHDEHVSRAGSSSRSGQHRRARPPQTAQRQRDRRLVTT